jgi:hypothetical protein
MSKHERRCFVCYEKGQGGQDVIHQRRFLLPDEPVPRCEQHGPLKPQPNNRYMGKPVGG